MSSCNDLDSERYRKLRSMVRISAGSVDMSGSSYQHARITISMKIPSGVHGDGDILDYMVDHYGLN